MLTKSEKKRILEGLCYYDPRNPDCECIEEDVYPNPKCMCDNCFYGQTWLAEKILKMEDQLRKAAWRRAQG